MEYKREIDIAVEILIKDINKGVIDNNIMAQMCDLTNYDYDYLIAYIQKFYNLKKENGDYKIISE